MRFDLYGSVHKGVRALLFSTVGQVARTDFSRSDEAQAALDAVERLFRFLEEHAENEDRVIMPVLQRFSDETFAVLEADHAHTERLQAEAAQLVKRLRDATTRRRVHLARRLHACLCQLVALHLQHMERQERDGHRALWAHLTDQELLALQEQIVREMPPAQMADALSVLLPAMSVPERAALVGGLRSKVPGEVFAELTAPARRVLGGEEWAATAAAAGF
jgi:hypothetical protein